MLGDYVARIYAICECFKRLPFDVKYELSCKLARHLYGGILVKLNSVTMDRIDIIWRKSVRRLMKLPFRSHSIYLPLIAGDCGVFQCLILGQIGFLRKAFNSSNEIVKISASSALTGSHSNFCESFTYICVYLGGDAKEMLNSKWEKLKIDIPRKFLRKKLGKYSNLKEMILTKSVFSIELLHERDYGGVCKEIANVILSYVLLANLQA